VNWTHLFVALVVVGWAVSVEYRLWANLRILTEKLKPRMREESSHLHSVGK